MAEVQNGSSKAVAFSAMKVQLFVQDRKCSDAVDFYKNAFGAEELSRAMYPKRKAEQDEPLILAAEMKIGNASFVLSDVPDDSNDQSEKRSTGFIFCLETENVDDAVEAVVSAGGMKDGEIGDGDGACVDARVGKVKDPYGFVWRIHSPVKKDETVTA